MMATVTATRDCGWVTAILYSRLAMRLRSLVIILPIHLFTITRVHVCNRIPPITILMPIRPNAGVRTLTLLSLFGKRIRFPHGTHECYPYSACRTRVRQNRLRIAPKVERVNCIRSIEMGSNTDSCIEHPLSKST